MIASRFVKLDYEKFGKVKGVTDREYYTNSYHVFADIDKKLELEKEFEKYSLGGFVSYVSLAELRKDNKKLEDYIPYFYENMQYVEVKDSEACPMCGSLSLKEEDNNITCLECNYSFKK